MTSEIIPPIPLDPIGVLSRDLRKAAVTLSDKEARFLVDAYYLMQGQRIRAGNQLRAMSEEPHAVLAWLGEQSERLENQVKAALDAYTFGHPVGPWLRAVKGIGPVIAAGLLAHIDIRQAPTVGHIWRFAGLDPTNHWEKGKKRPWNASLKVICWKAGESFVKVSGSDDAVYGRLYRQRKDSETMRNEAGAFAEQAAAALAAKRYGADTEAKKAYGAGRLPPAHIHARAKRWAVKQFLADLHGEMHRTMLGGEPPLPYPVAILGHAHHRKVS
jgi:hypothetical protein